MKKRIKFLMVTYFVFSGFNAISQNNFKDRLLNHVGIECLVVENGKNVRRTFEGLGEDSASGEYKPVNYDIVVKLNNGFNREEYYIQILIEEYITPSTEFSVEGNKLHEGWIPINVVYSDLASRTKGNMLIVHNPEYKLVYGFGSILYTTNKIRIVVTSQHRKTKQIQYLIKDYEIPM